MEIAKCVTKGIAVFVGLLLLAKGAAIASELGKAQSALTALKDALLNGQIARVEIFFLPYHISTPFPVTPEMLEARAERWFNFDLPSDRINALMHAIEVTELKELNDVPDLRWGALFLDKSGVLLHSIFLEGNYSRKLGRKGLINRTAIALNNALIDWFESNL